MADSLSMALTELLRKAEAEPDLDTLREGVRVLTQALMELEVAQQAVREVYNRQMRSHPGGRRVDVVWSFPATVAAFIAVESAYNLSWGESTEEEGAVNAENRSVIRDVLVLKDVNPAVFDVLLSHLRDGCGAGHAADEQESGNDHPRLDRDSQIGEDGQRKRNQPDDDICLC